MFDHSMKPPVMPPETKKADLYKSPEVFKKLDERAIEVNNNSFFIYDWYMYNIDKITHVHINFHIYTILMITADQQGLQ